MYEYLEGRLADRSAASLVLDVGGVGYDLAVPVGARFDADRPGVGGEALTRAWVHLVVREDAQLLYGFPSRQQRELFRALLSVRGVGPGVALGLLSGLSSDEIRSAVANEDVQRLQSVRGVGKKTAQQIVLDLRDKIDRLAGDLELVPMGAPRASNPLERNVADAIAALVSLEYPEKEAKKRVERAAREVEAEDLELLVRTALTF